MEDMITLIPERDGLERNLTCEYAAEKGINPNGDITDGMELYCLLTKEPGTGKRFIIYWHRHEEQLIYSYTKELHRF